MKKNRHVLLTLFLSSFFFCNIFAQKTDTTTTTTTAPKDENVLGVYVFKSKKINIPAFNPKPPKLQWLNPSDTVSKDVFPLILEVTTSYGIQEVKAKVNGIDVDLEPLFLKKEAFQRQMTKEDTRLVKRGVDNSNKIQRFQLNKGATIGEVDTLKLPLKNGDNLISISISNDGKVAKDTSFYVFYEYRPVLHLVTIGVNKYLHNKNLPQGEKSYMKDLKYPANDAIAIQKAYRKQKYLYRDIKYYHLINEDATKSNIIDLIHEKLKPSVQENDKVVLFFAAHGEKENEKQDVRFMPYDFDPDEKALTGIFGYEITTPIKNLNCKSLLIFDACHSGDLVRNSTSIQESSVLLEDYFINSRQVVLTASVGEAYEHDQWGHGALTKAILEVFSNEVDKKFVPNYGNPDNPMALSLQTQEPITTIELMNEIAEDNSIQTQELLPYVVHRVPELVREKSGKQRPLHYGIADFSIYEVSTKKQLSRKTD